MRRIFIFLVILFAGCASTKQTLHITANIKEMSELRNSDISVSLVIERD